MRQTKSEIYLHIVWATSRREPFLAPDIERAVHRCIANEAMRLGCTVIALGGMPDHIHLAVKIPTHRSVSRIMNHIKSLSSRFIHDKFDELDGFAWQEGYGVFSVGRNQLPRLIAYVGNQKRHHADGSVHPAWEETDEEYIPPQSPAFGSLEATE